MLPVHAGPMSHGAAGLGRRLRAGAATHGEQQQQRLSGRIVFEEPPTATA